MLEPACLFVVLLRKCFTPVCYFLRDAMRWNEAVTWSCQQIPLEFLISESVIKYVLSRFPIFYQEWSQCGSQGRLLAHGPSDWSFNSYVLSLLVISCDSDCCFPLSPTSHLRHLRKGSQGWKKTLIRSASFALVSLALPPCGTESHYKEPHSSMAHPHPCSFALPASDHLFSL